MRRHKGTRVFKPVQKTGCSLSIGQWRYVHKKLTGRSMAVVADSWDEVHALWRDFGYDKIIAALDGYSPEKYIRGELDV